MAKKACSYCGNNSGKTDSKGLCISCGGKLEIESPKPTIEYEYNGASGTLWRMPNFNILTPTEMREMYLVEDE